MNGTVVIAGGGPVGLMLACELGLAGVSTTVLERRTDRPTTSHGMSFHAKSLRLLEQRGLAGRIPEGEMFLWPRTPFSLLWLNLEAGDPSDYTYVYHHWRLARLLEERAAELGVKVLRGCEVVGFHPDADGVDVTVASGVGETSLRADYLVGADGAGSLVRHLAGIEFTGRLEGFAGVFGDVPVADAGQHLFDAGVHPAGLFGAMPIDPEFLRLMTVEIGATPADGATETTVEDLQESMHRVLGKPVEVATTRALGRLEGATRLASAYRAGRVFLVGDAAHTLFFSGTQNLNAGLHDAMNLGWKLAAVLAGGAPAGLLDTYEIERRPIGEAVCAHADAVLSLMHPLENVLELRQIVDELLKFDEVSRYLLKLPTRAVYPATAAHRLAGHPVPALTLSTPDGETTVDALLRVGRALVLDLSGGALDTAALAPWGGRLDVVTAQPAAAIDAACLLVRPDGYVAFAGPADDRTGLTAALSTWLGDPVPVDVA